LEVEDINIGGGADDENLIGMIGEVMMAVWQPPSYAY
jgi:hypothetical protein